MIFYVILVLSILYILFNNLNSQTVNDTHKVNRLVRQTARWATAAGQDTNAYISNLHATYAMGYLMALREIYDDNTIKRLSNVNVRELDIEVNKIMDDAIQKLVKTCPEGQPKHQFLAFLAKEGGHFVKIIKQK